MDAEVIQFPPRPSRAVVPKRAQTAQQIRRQAVVEAKARAVEQATYALTAQGYLKPGAELSNIRLWKVYNDAAKIALQASKELLAEARALLHSKKPPSNNTPDA